LLLQQQFQLTRLFKHQTLKEVEMLFWDRKYFLTIKLRKCSSYLGNVFIKAILFWYIHYFSSKNYIPVHHKYNYGFLLFSN
jgi:hypothetical protein